MENLMGNGRKIRKRGGCSPSSSTSSLVQNYRFNKRAILAGKKKSSVSRGKSVILRTAAASPRYPASVSGSGGQPMSARKLGAKLWELNEVVSPRVVVGDDVENDEGFIGKRVGRRGSVMRKGLSNSSCLPSHLSDPSHSPVSERMERSGTGRHRRTESSISWMLKTDHLDTVSNGSFMEIETRSRSQTPSRSTVVGKSRLKDVSNALTTSKELLKIISRMWSQEDQPSSRLSLVSALHTELERARLKVNQLIQEEIPDEKEIRHIVKLFAEEKAAWKMKEQEIVESMAGELEVERKLRRRVESLNKKLGKELAETKASLLNAMKELESEKKTRPFMEQGNGYNSMYHRRDVDLAFCQRDARDTDGENSCDSDIHSVTLNGYDPPDKLDTPSMTPRNSERLHVEEMKGRKSIFNHVARRSTSLLRSVSNIVQWGGNGSHHEIDKPVGRRSCGDDVERHKLAKGLRDHTLPNSRFGLERKIASPCNERGPPWPSREPCSAGFQRPATMEGNGMRGRLGEDRVEGQNTRR